MVYYPITFLLLFVIYSLYLERKKINITQESLL
jgi:hypothetical protein